MKIAVIAHLKFPIAAPFAGGLERHTHALVAGLRERGHEAILFAATGSDAALSPVEVCDPTGPHTGDPDRDAVLDRIEGDAYARIMREIVAGGFDIVHANGLHGLPLREATRLRLPTVTVLHVPRFEPFESALRDSAAGLRIIAVSPQLAEIWSDVSDRIEIVGNGVDLQTFTPDESSPRGEYALWSGRISPEKGLHFAIDAARLAGMDLAFAGPRPEDDPYWREEIAPRLGPGVTDLGHLGEAELSARLRRARVAVTTPCWEEPFGLVVVEALASGTPVAAFRRGALPDILDETTGRLAAPGDAADLARALREASTLDGKACRARAEALFGIDRMLDAYEVLYRDVVGKSATPVPA